jgi:hypothetical protein
MLLADKYKSVQIKNFYHYDRRKTVMRKIGNPSRKEVIIDEEDSFDDHNDACSRYYCGGVCNKR